MKYFLMKMLVLVMLLSTSSAWSLDITSWKGIYNTGSDVWIEVKDKPNNAQDWIGIYLAGSTNSWSNVVAWKWANEPSDAQDPGDWYNFENLGNGIYEARFFLNNTFSVEDRVAFEVGRVSEPLLSTIKDTYEVNEKVTAKVNVVLSGDQDWVGIYPAGSSNSWGNVIAWNWVEQKGDIRLDRVRKEMPAGEYEVRLFFHNSFNLVAKASLSVGGGAVNYAAYGSYTSERTDVSQRISIYKPKKDGVFKQNSPVVIVGAGGWNNTGRRQENFINFIVSKGYFVIGVGTSTDRDTEFNSILGTLNAQGNLIDKTKIGLMGSSTGGGTIFYNLKRLKDEGYATRNFVISLDGWFALGLTAAEVRNLDTTTLLLQFGGADGLRYHGTETEDPLYGDRDHYQDPRILMSIYNMLPGNEKSLSFLNNNLHGYASGSMNGKEDMLKVVGAMLAYKFENGGQAARSVALNNKYDEINAAKFNVGKYHYGCTVTVANQAYDYCDVNNPQ